MRLTRILLLSLLVVATSSLASTRLFIQSEPGDYIGGGATQTYTAPGTPVTVSGTRSQISAAAGGYDLTLAPAPGGLLGAGAYEGAARYPFEGTSPGLDFSGNGRGCNTLTGRFVILSVSYDGSGNLTSLAADFEQHCEGGSAAMWGELRFNTSYPLTSEKPAGSTFPDNFDFGGQAMVPSGTTLTSASSTIYGINAPADITITGGQYSINGGAFTALPGTVHNKDRVQVRATASTTPGASTTATVTVGGDAQGTFTLITITSGQPVTGAIFYSYPGDYIGGGQTLYVHAPDWNISLGTAYNYGYGVGLVGGGAQGRSFSLELAGPNHGALAVGAYEDAARTAFANASPGIDMSMDSRGCNEDAGRFVVLEIDLAATPPKIAVDFEQWCDGDSAPMIGEIRYNSAIPFSFQVTDPDPTPDAMAFAAGNPVRSGSLVYSNYSRIYGVNTSVPLSITDGEYSVNDGPFTSSPGSAQQFDLIRVRAKASPVPGAIRQAVLHAGDFSTAFSMQTYSKSMALTGSYLRGTGDYVLGSQTLFFPSPANGLTLQPYGTGVEASISGYGGHWFFALLGGPDSTPLAVGTYPANRSGDATHAMLDFEGDGRGCNITSGTVNVLEVEYDAGSVTKLAVDFQQLCEGVGQPAFGQIRYNSTVPLSPYLAPNMPQDASGDAMDDLVWQHTDGRVAMWLMNGLTPEGTAEILGPGSGWTVTHIADFDGDGKVDYLWQHPDGRAAIWLMNGTTPTATAQILNSASGWTVTHTADLDGDGKADLVFRNTDGSVAIWLMNGTVSSSGATILGAGTGWSVVKAGDFDGDGKQDLLLQHADGRAAIYLMNGIGVKSTAQILNAGPWTAALVGDLNGDGRDDIVWSNSDGSVAAWLMNGTSMLSGATLLNAGTGWTVKRLADFDGDGKTDLYFEHPDGRAAIWLMNGLTPSSTGQLLNAGSPWKLVRTADLDGDGRADIIWQHTDGRVAAWLMLGTSMGSGSGILGGGTGWSVSTAAP